MSNPNSNTTQTYSTFSSTSSFSYQDSSGNISSSHTISDPSGTTIHRTTQTAGQPAQTETTRLPPGGAAQVQGGRSAAGGRIEDVTDADRQYEERIQDEYAKREGGA